WLAIRQYLTRMHQLDARVGWSMAERLAGELATRTGVPVPEGVPAGAYLAAVVNERQARDARRVFAAGRGSAVQAGSGQAEGADAGAGGQAGSWALNGGAVASPPAEPLPVESLSAAEVAGASAPVGPVVEERGAAPAATGFAPPA
ncbi:RDD family protein, partial [Streptomyces sp. NPDC088178]